MRFYNVSEIQENMMNEFHDDIDLFPLDDLLADCGEDQEEYEDDRRNHDDDDMPYEEIGSFFDEEYSIY
jgi:hypothetical protein